MVTLPVLRNSHVSSASNRDARFSRARLYPHLGYRTLKQESYVTLTATSEILNHEKKTATWHLVPAQVELLMGGIPERSFFTQKDREPPSRSKGRVNHLSKGLGFRVWGLGFS